MKLPAGGRDHQGTPLREKQSGDCRYPFHHASDREGPHPPHLHQDRSFQQGLTDHPVGAKSEEIIRIPLIAAACTLKGPDLRHILAQLPDSPATPLSVPNGKGAYLTVKKSVVCIIRILFSRQDDLVPLYKLFLKEVFKGFVGIPQALENHLRPFKIFRLAKGGPTRRGLMHNGSHVGNTIAQLDEFRTITQERGMFHLKPFPLRLWQHLVVTHFQDIAENHIAEPGRNLSRKGFGILNGIMEQSRRKNVLIGDASHSSQQMSHFKGMVDVGGVPGIFPPLVGMFLRRKTGRFQNFLHTCINLTDLLPEFRQQRSSAKIIFSAG